MASTAEAPLRATISQLDADVEWFDHVTGTPSAPGWIELVEVVADRAVVEGWVAELVAGAARGNRDVAGSYLAGWLGGALAAPVALAVVTQRRAWPVVAERLALRRDDGGWFDGLAVHPGPLRVLPDDVAAGGPGTRVVADLATLRRLVAAELAALLAPLFRTIRSRVPFGIRGMWGTVADAVASRLLARARQRGEDGDAAWREAELLVAAVAAAAGVAVPRPGRDRVAWSGGTSLVPVRGTCCLYYKLAAGGPDGYCTSCPLRDEAERHHRWRVALAAEARGGDGVA